MKDERMRVRIATSALLCALTGFLLAAGCKSKPLVEPPYTAADGAVGFAVKLETDKSNLDGPTRWLATHTSGGHTAQFRIEFDGAKDSSRLGEGRLVAVTGSDAIVLMRELNKALEAKALPARVTRMESVPFEYFVLGGNLYRQTDGGLSGDREGNWTAIKLFFGQHDEGELFLNLNPVLGKGEFSIKDPDYGDYLVAELAKVL
jgi:hypothetical protein